MSVRTTNDEAICMYDSVTGRAFGPVFDNQFLVEDFLEWLQSDPRAYTAEQLDDEHREWYGQQG